MKKERKKVLILLSTNIYGGAERVLTDYLSDNQEFDFFLLTNRDPSICNKYAEVLPRGHIITTRFVLCRWNLKSHPQKLIRWIISFLYSSWKAGRIVKKQQIDVLYGNNSTDLPVLVHLKRSNPKLKNIAHIHDMLETDSMMGRYLMKHYPSLDDILVPSKANAKYIGELIKNSVPITVAYNSVPGIKEAGNVRRDDCEIQQHGKSYRIAMVGTISERKDPMLFLRIIKQLSVPYEAVIAGPILDETLFLKLKEEIQKEHLNVNYLGTLDRKQMQTLYAGTDLLILSSRRDSLPTVILEAMAAGTLVLAKDVGGVPEMIEEEITGFLFQEEDQEKQIALKASYILTLEEEKKQQIRREAKRKLVSQFSEEEKRRRIRLVIDGRKSML